MTIEMEVANQGMIFTYNPQDWNWWMVRSDRLRVKHFFQLGDHVEVSKCFHSYVHITDI